MLSEDRDFACWSKFFSIDAASLSRFIYLLKKCDFYFLSNGVLEDFDDERTQLIYPSGFLEGDFQRVLSNENPKDSYFKTRIAIALSYSVNLSGIKKKLGNENFYFVIERVLIDGYYEKYGIKYEKLLVDVVAKYDFPKSEVMDVSLMRGVSLGSRYNKIEDFLLRFHQYKNYFFSFLGV